MSATDLVSHNILSVVEQPGMSFANISELFVVKEVQVEIDLVSYAICHYLHSWVSACGNNLVVNVSVIVEVFHMEDFQRVEQLGKVQNVKLILALEDLTVHVEIIL